MGLSHTIPKLLMSGALATGPIMFAYGCRLLDDVPSALIKANGGTGPDKGDWSATYFGTTREMLLLCIGICKMAAFADIWLLHIMPKFACVCVGSMLMAITVVHYVIDDDLPPPVVMGSMAFITAATWPTPEPKKKMKK